SPSGTTHRAARPARKVARIVGRRAGRPHPFHPAVRSSTLVRSDPKSAGHIVAVPRRRAWRSSRPRSVEVQAACLPEGRLESGNRGDAAPLAPFAATGAVDGVLARVGPGPRDPGFKVPAIFLCTARPRTAVVRHSAPYNELQGPHWERHDPRAV